MELVVLARTLRLLLAVFRSMSRIERHILRQFCWCTWPGINFSNQKPLPEYHGELYFTCAFSFLRTFQLQNTTGYTIWHTSFFEGLSSGRCCITYLNYAHDQNRCHEYNQEVRREKNKLRSLNACKNSGIFHILFAQTFSRRSGCHRRMKDNERKIHSVETDVTLRGEQMAKQVALRQGKL